MKRRALLVVHSYYLTDTRPRRHATALADAGWTVDVLCARDEGESPFETVAGVRINRIPARRRRGSKLRYIFEYASFAAMAFLAVTMLHFRKRYDTVYVMGIPNFLVFSALVPRLTGALVLLDMRDPFPEFLRARYDLKPGHPLVRLALLEERVSCRLASRVLTATPLAASLHARSVPRERSTVIMNAPDPRVFHEVGPNTNAKERTMLYAGTVGRRHGVDVAMRALAALRDDIPELRLRIVGDGDLVPEIPSLAAELGISDRITLEPAQPIDRMPAIFQEAWLGVQPNRPDPFMELLLPVKVLEWSRMGLPVACGETMPLREIFTDDELFFHEPGDLKGLCARILEAHDDPAALEIRIERARAAGSRIRYEDQIETLLEVAAG